MLISNISLSRVMDTMAEGVLALDQSCNIALWNKAMEEMTGWKSCEMMGKSCTDLLISKESHIDDNTTEAQSDCALLLHVDNKKTVSQSECLLSRKNNEPIPVLKNGRVLFDDNKNPAGVVVTLTDLRPLRKLELDLAVMRHDSTPIQGIGRLIGSSQKMLDIYERIRLASDSDITVFIEGETGTGKELVAEAIHTMSTRKDKPLLKVNCSALPENLLESELFGHVKGAFTGAIKDKIGRIELAEGGTLFLDEIGDISPLIQLKLLRILQEHEYERVGESSPRKANVRFIVATHRNLKQYVSEGLFREDFYYRVRIFSIKLPPLREHKEDIHLLCNSFIQRINKRTNKHILRLSHDTSHALMDYCWPGNIRELENSIEHAFVTCQAECIELDDLPVELRTARQRTIECGGNDLVNSNSAKTSSTPLTREKLLETLHEHKWNQSKSAQHLGIDRTTVWRKMKQWNIDIPA